MIDFVIAGAQKSGTTALAHFLNQHSEVAMSQPKETHVFDTQGLDLETIDSRYAPFFEDATQTQLRGEATPIYLFLPDVLKALSEYNQSLKIIVLLRDPIDRAISHYEMARDRGEELFPLWRALLAESRRLKSDQTPLSEGSATRNHSYRSRGYYSRQLKCLYQYFNPEQVLILSMSQLMARHKKTVESVFTFLGVDPSFQVRSEIVFSMGGPKKRYPVSRFILKLCYLLEYDRMRRYIEAF
ncbi:MAG: sulfotransferase [Crocinitomicaceae bacterium]|nr:sulfotransferase [Crocinitomicaceae bacterium]